MPSTIFFSWQIDTPPISGRNFIRKTLEAICKDLAADTTLAEAARNLNVDSDTQDIAGQPPIAETILKKIDSAAVVVADMTFTGKRIDGRPTPNPNVLIEYGWAQKALGHNRVISVMNTVYGKPSHATLPFDLAHLRWPMTYTLAENADDETRAEQKRELTRALKKAVLASLAVVPMPEVPAPPRFPEASAQDGPARFRGRGEALGLDDDLIAGGNRDVFLAEGPAVWLRLMPTQDQRKRWPTADLLRAGQENGALHPLRAEAGNYSYVRASDGQGIYRMRPVESNADKPIVTGTVGFAFRSGEVWSIDTTLLDFDKNSIFFDAVKEMLAGAADRYRRFLRRLGIAGPYRWVAGLAGVKGRILRVQPKSPYHLLENPVCATDHIEVTGDLTEEQPAIEALTPFFAAIFEECGVDPSLM